MTVQSYLRNLKTLQIVLLSGYILAIILSVSLFLINIVPLLPGINDTTVLDIIIIALSVSGTFSSFYLFQVLLLRQSSSSSLARKLSAYKTSYFLRLAIIESVGMIAVVIFMISLSMIALTISILIAILIGFLKPSRREISRTLQLNPAEVAQINSKQTVLATIEQEIFKHRLN